MHNTQFTTILDDIDLGDITEAKKMALLDDVGTLLTHRILVKLVQNVPQEKKELFITKITENKDNPDKILLFIDHFVDNANDIINTEILRCKDDMKSIIQTT